MMSGKIFFVVLAAFCFAQSFAAPTFDESAKNDLQVEGLRTDLIAFHHEVSPKNHTRSIIGCVKAAVGAFKTGLKLKGLLDEWRDISTKLDSDVAACKADAPKIFFASEEDGEDTDETTTAEATTEVITTTKGTTQGPTTTVSDRPTVEECIAEAEAEADRRRGEVKGKIFPMLIETASSLWELRECLSIV